jgi:hypothetical protein
LEIFNNASLTSISGFNNLASVGTLTSDELRIARNPVLTSLSNFNNLTSIAGGLLIYANEELTSLGLDSLCSVGDLFRIFGNYNLCTNLAEDLRDQVLACPSGGIGGAVDISDNKSCP